MDKELVSKQLDKDVLNKAALTPTPTGYAPADQAIADVCTPGNPRKVTRADIVALYKRVL